VLKHNQQINNITRAITLQALWLSANRGILTQVAKQLGVSHQAVGAVYKGKTRSRRIEKALKQRGAPIAA
jgi:hypothetical protein